MKKENIVGFRVSKNHSREEVVQRIDVSGKSFNEVVDVKKHLQSYIDEKKFTIKVLTIDRKLIEFDYFKSGTIK